MGLCDPKVGKWEDVVAEKVPEDMATGTTIRWLIRREDGAPLFAMRLFEVEPGGHIKAHSHPWEHEIFILEGEARIRINGKDYIVGKDYYLYIPPNAVHEYWNTGSSVLRFLCIIPHQPSVDENTCKEGEHS